MQLAQELPQSLTQAVRIVNRAGQSVNEPSGPSEVLYVDCHRDTTSRQTIILWSDILDAFKK
ncbi:hypothetical protein BGZ95_008444, partial [Linnemannia exigua]